MRRFLGAGLITLLLAPSLLAQDRKDAYTNPSPPPREALERLNLKMAWRGFIPLDGRKDGILSIRITGRHLLIQTRSGLVVQLDAETGVVDWRNRVGNPYQTQYPLAFNSTGAFILNNNYLYGLDRDDGSIQFQMPVAGGISAPPTADEDQIYLPTVQGRLRAYHLPNFQMEREYREARAEAEAKQHLPKPTGSLDASKITLPPRGETEKIGSQPILAWTVPTNLLLDFQPQAYRDTVVLASSSGRLTAFTKNPASTGEFLPLYRFQAEDEFLAPPGQFEDTLYLGSRDANVYALDLGTGRVLWRHTAGSAVYRRPFATREDLFVSSDRNGLTRLVRTGPRIGEATWSIRRGDRIINSQPDLDRVLAVNPKFVYATDRSGRLAIVDRIRGTILSTYDIRDFVVVTSNDLTDRIFLAAQNGLVLCLHDREYVTPYVHREQEYSLAHKLRRPINLPAAKEKPLKDVLRDLERDLHLKILLATATFKDQGVEGIENRPLTFKAIESVLLADALKQILDPIGATFKTSEQTLVILPDPKAKPVENPMDKPMDKPVDKPMDKDKEKAKDK